MRLFFFIFLLRCCGRSLFSSYFFLLQIKQIIEKYIVLVDFWEKDQSYKDCSKRVQSLRIVGICAKVENEKGIVSQFDPITQSFEF